MGAGVSSPLCCTSCGKGPVVVNLGADGGGASGAASSSSSAPAPKDGATGEAPPPCVLRSSFASNAAAENAALAASSADGAAQVASGGSGGDGDACGRAESFAECAQADDDEAEEDEGDRSDAEPMMPVPSASRVRRQGVAGVSVSSNSVRDFQKPVYKKTEESRALIEGVLRDSEKMQVLLGHLKGPALSDVVNAFFPKSVNKAVEIIRQGEEGDCLYIIASGSVNVFVRRPPADGSPEKDKQGRGDQVCSLGPGSLFGELALLYSSPRAATVVAASEVELWALDQVAFKMLVCGSSQARHALYEGWLAEVDIFKTLNQYELSRLSELLESELFDTDEEVVVQGDVGDRFYILEDGGCAAYIKGPSGEKKVKEYTEQGEYFGELALLNSEPRKATIRATGTGCSVVWVAKDDFQNLLGPIQDILKKQAGQYEKYADLIR